MPTTKGRSKEMMKSEYIITLNEYERQMVMNGLLALHDIQADECKADSQNLYNKIHAQVLEQKQAEREANLQKLAGQLLRAHY